MHRATRLHYDFRLEMAGVLVSWAIPKGPTFDPAERRLAMRTEDHPLDYRTFEGTIPSGNYGAGEVIVWDEGTWTLVEADDPVAAVEAGKIVFVLNGHKLHGEFTLVRMKPKNGERGDPWLFMKHRGDAFVDPSWKPEEHPESVVTGRTLADIKAGKGKIREWTSSKPAETPPAAVRKRAAAKSAKADPLPRDPKPMLATLVEGPFDDRAWLYELKWDGYRAIVTIDADGGVTMTSRGGLDLLHRFPPLRDLAPAFRSRPLVVDGEICVLDADGRSDFQKLQSWDPRARGKHDPLTFVAFDLLYADGRDLRGEPLVERKRRLQSLIVPDQGVLFSQHVERDGNGLYRLAQERGLEGIVGKLASSPYRSARSREWVKIKAKRRQEFVIGGWTEPRGSRSDFGALLLGVYEGDELVYAGHVGTGFDHAKLADLGKRLAALERKTPAFRAPVPKTNTKAHWVRPQLVCECTFTEWTRDGLLRHPVFLALRSDKDAADVVRERELATAEHV